MMHKQKSYKTDLAAMKRENYPGLLPLCLFSPRAADLVNY